MIYTADFETTTDPKDCRVWAWALCEIKNTVNFRYGTNIDEFFKVVTKTSNTLYFHNLKFDGEFLMYYLFRNDYTFVLDSKELKEKEFSCLISDTGQWYSIKICVKKLKKKAIFLTLFDSLKLLPFTVERIAESFHLENKKGHIDYRKVRPLGYAPDLNEIDYICNDVTICAKALQYLFSRDLRKMTTGSNALHNFKEIFNPGKFDRLFPVLTPELDQDIRYSYRGGFCWLNPKYKNKLLKSGIVLDVNSLYPHIMDVKLLPYDYPVYYTGQYEPDNMYPLYVCTFTCNFELKPDHIPTVQLKIKDCPALGGLDYLTSSKGLDVTMCMTSVDFQLFMDHYDVYNIQYHSGWKFKGAVGFFSEYIKIWSDIKIQAKKDKNYGMYIIAKLMLNSLYGKFASGTDATGKIPMYDGTLVKLTAGPKMTKDGIYIPMGTFITSYSRELTIRAAQETYDRIIYCDTDSRHLTGLQLPDTGDIHPSRLGAWKHELNFYKAKFLRAKTYLEYGRDPETGPRDWKIECKLVNGKLMQYGTKNKLKVTAAGLPYLCHAQVNFKTWKIGATFHGKLKPTHYPGGIILEDIDFTLSEKLSFFHL